MRIVDLIFSNGWVQTFGGAAIATFLGFRFIRDERDRRYAVIAGSISALLALVAATIVGFTNRQPPQRFSVGLLNSIGSLDPWSAVFFRVCNATTGEIIVPEPLALYLSVRNGSPLSATVSGLKVTGELTSGDWVELTRVPWNSGKNYMAAGDLSRATELKVPYLDERLTKSVGPGDSAEGWLYLATRDSVRRRYTGKFQIVITDTEGAASTATVRLGLGPTSGSLDREYGGYIQSTAIRRDISKLTMRAYDCAPDRDVFFGQ